MGLGSPPAGGERDREAGRLREALERLREIPWAADPREARLRLKLREGPDRGSSDL